MYIYIVYIHREDNKFKFVHLYHRVVNIRVYTQMIKNMLFITLVFKIMNFWCTLC